VFNLPARMCDQLLQISLSRAHTHIHRGVLTTIGKEYVCVLRLHSAIESETELAKVILNAFADLHCNQFLPSFPVSPPPPRTLDNGPDDWCVVPAASPHIGRQEATASQDNLREQTARV
jgi:hypothetical protein